MKLRYLTLEFSDDAQGLTTIEAMASTSAAEHGAVMAEARHLLDWAWQTHPHTHGAIDDGAEWDHDLQVHVEDGAWHAVALTLTASARFADEFRDRFERDNG
jgi:VCBS repeat-containing protein